MSAVAYESHEARAERLRRIDNHHMTEIATASAMAHSSVLDGGLLTFPDVHALPGQQSLDVATDERCRGLGMIPLQFVRWNPGLVRKAITGGVPAHLRVFKRAVDLIASISLGLLLLPFIPLIIWAIKWDSEGPALYSQVRLGEGGRRFRIYKFRSMYTDAEARGAQFATQNDARITAFGRFMRKTRIDELPQIWNVLRGDMSIVGPRPERPEHIERIKQAIPEFTLRTAVKPGLTGWAQVSFRYAGTVEELRTKLEYDLYYIQYASIWMEIRILLRTIKVVLGSKGQ